MNGNVRFEVPDYVSITSREFDGAEMTVEYDSNFGGVVTLKGEASINRTTVDIDGRKIRSNGHVFSADGGRHLGTVESVEVVLPHDTAVELVTENMDHDVDVGLESTIIQGWDRGVMEQEGFLAGTVEIRLRHGA